MLGGLDKGWNGNRRFGVGSGKKSVRSVAEGAKEEQKEGKEKGGKLLSLL